MVTIVLHLGNNRMGETREGAPAMGYYQGDTPEFGADIILQSIREGGGEYFANDRLKAMARR